MRVFAYLFILFITLSCQNSQKEHEQTGNNSVGLEHINHNKFSINPDSNKISLTEPTLVIIELDDEEVEKMREEQGEDDFMIIIDDVIYYDAMLKEKMDSLKVPILKSNKDTIKVLYSGMEMSIRKDSSFSIYTYFYFDGKNFEQKEVIDLIEE